MKKLVVLSDTHGNKNVAQQIYGLANDNDYVVHLGDGATDMRELRALFPEKVYACAGNCDLFTPLPDEGELEVEQVRILYCHGHRYGVKTSLDILAHVARLRDCQLVLYGHTHEARIDEIDGVMLVNPGSMRFAPGKGGSYCYLVINKKEFTPVIVGESCY